MKKLLSVLLCMALALGCGLAAAEAPKEDYTVVTVNGSFNIRGITPEGYQRASVEVDDPNMRVYFSPDDPGKPSFVLGIFFREDYAEVERLNDLDEEEMIAALVGDDPSVSENISIMETDYGTKVLILRSRDSQDDFACFVTLYKGYEVGLNLYPGAASDGALTDEQIRLAMTFLSDLDFVPFETGN